MTECDARGFGRMKWCRVNRAFTYRTYRFMWCNRARMMPASINCPLRAMVPATAGCCCTASAITGAASTLGRVCWKAQNVFESGIRLDDCRPRKRCKVTRSSAWYSTWSSERLYSCLITNNLIINRTGKGGRPPLETSTLGSRNATRSEMAWKSTVASNAARGHRYDPIYVPALRGQINFAWAWRSRNVLNR